MKRLCGLTLAATTIFATAALAAPEHQRIRGTVASISGDTLTVHTTDGKDVPVMLGSSTRFLKVEKSSLDRVDKGSFIGTATKTVGDRQVALEVVIFPAAMRGTGEGHYGWDQIPDTTQSGGGTTASAMTNGDISTVAPAGGATAVNSSMTNGTVAASGTQSGAKQITVTYKGGEQQILVPPTAPIVTFVPGAKSDVASGTTVFVNATNDDGKVTANSVAVGVNGAKPPM